MTRRRLIQAGLALPASLVAAGGYAGVIEPYFRLVTTRYTVTLPRWAGSAPFRIAAIADVHMGPPQMTPARLRTIVAETNALAPDLTVCLGDYRASHPYVTDVVPADVTAGILGELQAPLGVWAVLGNHDWTQDKDAQRTRRGPTFWHQALSDAGIAVMDNDAERLEILGAPVWLVGLGSQRAFLDPLGGVDDLAGTLARVTDTAPVILLAHEPDIFAEVPVQVALTLSGHTHGGQIRLPGFAPYVPSRFGNRYAYGHVTEEGRQLIVSGGLGCSMVPIRLGMPPEIVIIDVLPESRSLS